MITAPTVPITERLNLLESEARAALPRIDAHHHQLIEEFVRTARDALPRIDALGWGSAHAAITLAVDTERELLRRWLVIPDDYTGPTGEDRISAQAVMGEGLSRMLAWIESARQAAGAADAASLLVLGDALTMRYGPTFDAPRELEAATAAQRTRDRSLDLPPEFWEFATIALMITFVILVVIFGGA